MSLVIPGRNCAHTLPACLASCLPLLTGGELCEILFVNDGSTDQSAALAAQAGARVLYCPSKGPGAARNLGWRAAQGELIWFVDADCVVHPEALRHLLTRLQELGAAAVGGSYDNACAGSLTARLIHAEMVYRHARIGARSNFAITANLVCRKAVLEQLGGFDEHLQLAQDLDLAYRICAADYVLGFARASRVAHHHETRFQRYWWKQMRQGYWRMQLYRKHPSRMRGDSYSGWVDYAQPPLALLFAAGAVLTLTRAAGARRLALAALGSSALSGVSLVLLQLPMAWALRAQLPPREQAAYVAFGAVRAVGRGLGMAWGSVHVLRALAARASTT